MNLRRRSGEAEPRSAEDSIAAVLAVAATLRNSFQKAAAEPPAGRPERSGREVKGRLRGAAKAAGLRRRSNRNLKKQLLMMGANAADVRYLQVGQVDQR